MEIDRIPASPSNNQLIAERLFLFIFPNDTSRAQSGGEATLNETTTL